MSRAFVHSAPKTGDNGRTEEDGDGSYPDEANQADQKREEAKPHWRFRNVNTRHLTYDHPADNAMRKSAATTRAPAPRASSAPAIGQANFQN
jgi:hypothetical protein